MTNLDNHFANHCLNGFRVTLSTGDFNGANGITYAEDLLIASLTEDNLPFEESAIIPVDPKKSIKLITTFPLDYFDRADLSSYKTKKVKVILKIDINSFYEFKVEPVPDLSGIDSVKELSYTNNITTADKPIFTKKARIVTDKVNLFIYVYDENGTEYIIKDLNGSPLVPIYLAFTEAKPLMGQRAKDLYHKKAEYIVFDLLKLCSIDRKYELTPFWKFKVAKENNEKLMITLKTCDGHRRSSVEFLLALILKHVLQIIKDQTGGERMEKFQVDFDGFKANEILKENFVKAGKLANVETVFDSE
uniref:Uncharacterized protein n=1 Tax=Panagrolaimus sp. ES5 TaxID=591445 RepID=A0AC34G3D8_9BILA